MSEAQRAQGDLPPRLVTPLIGLTGASGVLPRWYSEVLISTLRVRSGAMRDFLDLVAHRLIAHYAAAGTKYRQHRAVEIGRRTGSSRNDPFQQVLLALCGFGTPGLVERLNFGPEPLEHYSGLFASQPRSADRLAALASDWLGREVEVVQFVGAWLPIAPADQSRMPAGRLPGAFNQLGRTIAAGSRAWDPQARVILRVGPLSRAAFAALMPDTAGLQRFVAMVRAFLGLETGFAVNPILRGSEIPPLRLAADADPPPRLGWNSWMPSPEPPAPGMPRPRDARDAIFDADVVERRAAARSMGES